LVSAPKSVLEVFYGGNVEFDAPAVGRAVLRAHNDWCIRIGRISPRLRTVAVVVTTSLKEAIAETERLIAGGVRAIAVCSALPIDGKAPAHPDNDVLWNLLADNKITAMLHIGGDVGFLANGAAWLNAPVFAERTLVPKEVPGNPFTFSTIYFGAVNYLNNLVMGGVFERVPDLRLGFAELNGAWGGPTAENLDMWAEQFPRRMKGILSMKPSEYIRRNVRITPFNFEPVDKYIERFPIIEDVYCFSSDYPHFEGGPDPRSVMIKKLGRLGPDEIEKFFVKNAEWLMPE